LEAFCHLPHFHALFCFLSLCDLSLPSLGFWASLGIAHTRLKRTAPSILFSAHSFSIRLTEIPTFLKLHLRTCNKLPYIHPDIQLLAIYIVYV
jgi:hypothetical protein